MTSSTYIIPKDAQFDGPPPQPTYVRFVEGVKIGMLPEEAARYAGIKSTHDFIDRAMKNPWVQQQIKEIRDEFEAKAQMSRNRVQDMVIKAYDMAEIQALPGDMIRACAELNKMLGYYAPEEKTITLETREGQLRAEYEIMDEEELLALAGQERDAIEAEFEELDMIHAQS